MKFGRITRLKIRFLLQKKKKKKPMEVPNNKFLLKKTQITKNNCSGVVHAFTGFVTVSVKKIMTETVDIA